MLRKWPLGLGPSAKVPMLSKSLPATQILKEEEEEEQQQMLSVVVKF